MGEDEFGLAGSGGWSDCDPKREHHHEVVIKFDDRQAPSKWVDYMDEVKANAVKISADMGLSILRQPQPVHYWRVARSRRVIRFHIPDNT